MAAIRWTPQQVEAIRSTDDTLLVANAGTGKTTTVVGKILWRLGLPFGVDDRTGRPLDPPPDPCALHEIAAITFTEKAAYDLKRQLRRRIEESPRADELRWELDRASVGTIHSFCSELLRENALRLGIDPTFDILDGDEAWAEQDRLIRELILERAEEGHPAPRLLLQHFRLSPTKWQKGLVDHLRDVVRELRWHGDPGAADACIEGLAPGGVAPGDAAMLEICDALLELGREARERWDAWLEEENRRDFDSLILGARDLLTDGRAGAALRAIRERWRLLIVDEFQDTDFAQRDIAFAIGRPGGEAGSARAPGAAESGPEGGSAAPQLFLVGDPKQSIYRFRGADIAVWNEVEASFRAESGRILDLSRTFRNAPSIVRFVNHTARAAIETTGEALDRRGLGGRVRYSDLVPGVEPFDPAAVEWLVAEGDRAGDRRESEAHRVARWIRRHVGELEVRDPDGGEPRPLAYRDCAVLYRARQGLEHYEQALTRYGIPHYVAGASYLGSRQEIVDVLNTLRVLQTPRDDLRAFGFLRSPFVGLRDETIARIRLLSSRAPLLRQARRFLEDGEWPPAPDHPALAEIERDGLRRGLDLLDELRPASARLPLDELIEELLDRSGYRLHVLLLDRPEEVLANLQSLIHFAGGYRHLDLTAFFEVWERSARQEARIPQAPLYAKDDDVVTLSTIHAAKGLEWPVVFLVGVEKEIVRTRTNEFWTDRELGPVFCLKKADRGPHADEIAEREELEAAAEEARLLYVAATRARDRLVIAGELGGEKGYDQWLRTAVEAGEGAGQAAAEVREGAGEAAAEEGVEAGEVEAGEVGAGEAADEGGDPSPLVRVRKGAFDVERPAPPTPPALTWLDAWEAGPPPALIEPIAAPPFRWIHSATELMLKDRDPEAWERRYRYGIEAPWEFAPVPASAAGGGDGGEGGEAPERRLPSTVRGDIIHGVLERLEDAAELSRILDETIGSLDEPELEELLTPGGRYREALEREIRGVVESPEWAWYTAGELGRDYWKELTFTHLVGRRDWRFGAFDLYRRAGAGGGAAGRAVGPGDEAGDGAAGAGSLIVDFKTHPVTAAQAGDVAEGYRIQAEVYRAAARIAGPVEVRLHFTGPNAVVEMEEAE